MVYESLIETAVSSRIAARLVGRLDQDWQSPVRIDAAWYT
jgi:hypothetical protein